MSPRSGVTEWSAAKTRQIVEKRAIAEYADTYNWIGGRVPCECCGEWCYAEMHHRQFRSRGGDWRPSNIVALCHFCHHRVTTCHNGWARELGWSVTQWGRPEEAPVVPWYGHGRRVRLDNEGGFVVLEPAA